MKCKTSSAALASKILLPALIVVLSSCASNQSQDTDDVEEPTTVVTPIDEAEEAVTEPIEEAVSLDYVFYFDFDKSTLTSGTRAALDAQAAALRGGSATVRLEGHADERGTREYNIALGQSRAEAIADYLAIQGVARSRIEVVSYGEERPVALGASESDYSANRRVELK